MRIKHIFTKDADRREKAALLDVENASKGADQATKRLKKLLLQNGVTMQIYIATGGDRRGH